MCKSDSFNLSVCGKNKTEASKATTQINNQIEAICSCGTYHVNEDICEKLCELKNTNFMHHCYLAFYHRLYFIGSSYEHFHLIGLAMLVIFHSNRTVASSDNSTAHK